MNIGTLAVYLDGEQLIPIILGILLLVLLVLFLSAWAIFRFSKKRFGNKAYLLAASPFVLAGIALVIEYELEKPNSGGPTVLSAQEIPHLIDSLPPYASFSFSGLSYFNGDLFVGSNLGIFQIHDGQISKLLRFQRNDSVVSGPWADIANHLLWAKDDHTQELLRFDGNKWTRQQEPTPAKGYYSRGDALEGLQPIGNATGLWMATAGSAWKWNPQPQTWEIIQTKLERHKDFQHANKISGVLPIGSTPLLLVRNQPLAFLVKPDEEDFPSDELYLPANIDEPIKREGKAFLADTWTVTNDAGYICTKNQSLFKVTTQLVSQLSAPGKCEAVATDHNANLLVSIKTKGIFRYSGNGWEQILPSPYPSGNGEYWTYLAEANGQLAVAIVAKPVVDHDKSSGTNMEFTHNARTALWISKNGALQPVKFR